MNYLVFDIETAPLDAVELESMIPAFDESEVKTGNIKDPTKIQEKIESERQKHRQQFIDDAALDATTGKVLAIGVSLKGEKIILHGEERDILKKFWDMAQEQVGSGFLIGFNCNSFDLPFLYRRSWKHGIATAAGLRRGRYFADCVVDLREVWQLGDRQARGSLATVSKHLGIGEKSGDGAQFAKLWETDRAAAEKYMLNDIELTEKMAKKFSII
jgi:DNA polymerase elongation subunit (family B)